MPVTTGNSKFWFTSPKRSVIDKDGWRSVTGKNGREWRERELADGSIERVYINRTGFEERA